jgi:hypothetical protein
LEWFKPPNRVEEITITILFNSGRVRRLFMGTPGAAWEAMDSAIHNTNLPCLHVLNIHFYEAEMLFHRSLTETAVIELTASVLLRMNHLRSRNILSVKTVSG